MKTFFRRSSMVIKKGELCRKTESVTLQHVIIHLRREPIFVRIAARILTCGYIDRKANAWRERKSLLSISDEWA